MNNNIYYAGIGSRETPIYILDWFEKVGTTLAERGFTLRSGGANGADKAFEIGCDKVQGLKEIYLPWKGFEGSTSKLIVYDHRAYDIAEKHHPYWHNLSVGARKLQARNSHQVLGQNLESPSNFVICWTKNGKGSGGTGQAIRIAKAYTIPVFDAGFSSDIEVLRVELRKFVMHVL